MSTGEESANEYTWFVLNSFWGLPLGWRSETERCVKLHSCSSVTNSRGSPLNNQQLDKNPVTLSRFSVRLLKWNIEALAKFRSASAAWSCPICQMSLAAMKRQGEEKKNGNAPWMIDVAASSGFFSLISTVNVTTRKALWRMAVKWKGHWVLTQISFVGTGKEQPPFHLYVCVRTCFSLAAHCSQVRL